MMVTASIATGKRNQLEFSIRLGSFLLVAWSAVALFLTQRMPASASILLLGSVAVWLWKPKESHSGFWEIASFAYLIFFFIDLFRISGALAPALVHLFIFILLNKQWNLHGPRDYYQLYLLTFLTILAASSLSVETEMFYTILLYILILMWNMVSLTLYKEWEKEQTIPFPFSLFHPLYGIFVILSSVLTFLIAIGIFFILPRMQLGFFSSLNPGRVQHVSGFSQKVELGEMAAIQDDPTLTLRIRVTPRKSTGDLYYWRGMAFDHYDGKSWTSTFAKNRFLWHDSSDTFFNGPFVEEAGLIKQEVYVEPMDTRVIFALDRVLRLKGQFHGITRDNNGTLTGMGNVQNYVAYSRINRLSHSAVKEGTEEIPDVIRQYYLQLPYRSREIQELGESLIAGKKDPIDQILAVSEYFQNNYTYSTTDLPEAGEDPIRSFLFEKKSGHCEYFASSMVILLRHIGIPSRLVNGFLEGEYNEVGDFYAVRQTDAHSWVEVYLNGSWYPVDPSPRQIQSAGGLQFGISIRQILDSVAFFWDRYILIFSAQDQIDSLMALRDQYRRIRQSTSQGMERLPDRLIGPVSRLWSYHGRLFFVGIVWFILVVAAFWKWHKNLRKKRMIQSPVLFYQQMLAILDRKGFSKSPHSTPAEFIQSIRDRVPASWVPDLSTITELFYRSRFGNYRLTPSDSKSVEESLARLEQMR